MRIGTWNMAGRGSSQHAAFLRKQDCDVLLLTEVKVGWSLDDDYHLTEGGEGMTVDKRWAVVASKHPLKTCTSPHPASVAAKIGSTTYVSSILPWKGCGDVHPWDGSDHISRMTATLTKLAPFLEDNKANLVWGGDWNHALVGPERAGSAAGRDALRVLLAELDLEVSTIDLQHRLPEIFTIDHIALRGSTHQALRVDAAGLSDHDFYMVVTHDVPH